MTIIENSHATYQRLHKFYGRKLNTAKKHAGSMHKYMSKADTMKSETDAKLINNIGLVLKATLFRVIAHFWQKRIHGCADRVERLATKHLDFWTGTGGIYCKEIRMLDPDYAEEVERKNREARKRDRHCRHYGGDAYDPSFFPY